MSKASIETALRGLIVNELCVEDAQVTDDAHFVNDLGADSLNCIELAMQIEDYFGIEIPDVDAAPIRTLKAWVEYLENRHLSLAA